ncbi:DUF86 domain-containing protein [Coleofasciculus sp. E2-BRE-01]|uniref:DUF86 domain-containing protein n=1 Tax=Coleofasciculus sp. E2-BRE-01 TaxID=3069524 RepID=UPI0032F362C0
MRLRLIAKYRNALEEFRSISLNEYLANFRQQLIVERLLQLMVEAATDINKYILVRCYQISTVKYTDAFIEAGRQGIITAEPKSFNSIFTVYQTNYKLYQFTRVGGQQ